MWKRVGSRVRDRGTKEVDVEKKKSRDGTRALAHKGQVDARHWLDGGMGT